MINTLDNNVGSFANVDLYNKTSSKQNSSFFKRFAVQVSDKLNGAWYCFKDCLREPTDLGKIIRALAANGYQDQDCATLVEAFASKEYPQLIFFISKILNQLDDRQLNEFVKELFIAHGIENSPTLIKKLKGLLTLQKIEEMIRTEFPRFSSTRETANKMKEIHKAEREIRKVELQRSFRATASIYLHKGIEFVLNMLIYLTRLKQFLPGERSDYIPDSYISDMQYQNFLNNIAIFSGWLMALSLITGDIVLGGLILGGGLISLAAIAYIYNKYFKPLPEEIAGTTNLTKIAQNGQLPPVCGRDYEIRALIDALCSNNETTRKHPILTGQSRVGKTEIVNGLVHYINNAADVEPELKGKKVLYINASDLNYEGTLNKILKEIQGHESEYIFFFDEFHSIFMANKTSLKNKFKTLLDPGKNGLKYCIFATTTKEYNQSIAPEDAIVARLSEILVKPLDEEKIFPILRKMVEGEAPDLVVDLEAIQAVANIHKDYDEYQGCSQPFTSKVILSQVFAQVRNYKYMDKEDELEKLKIKKLRIESSEETYQPTSFLFSEESLQRSSEMEKIDLEIQRLEREISDSKDKVKKFLETVRKCSELRKEIENKASQFSANPSEGELQEFILEYYYLQTAFHRKITQERQNYPQSVVSLDRIQQHIEDEVAKKRAAEALAKK
ncbi:MAG: AAA family ATPase [Chlamydiales bacterium]